MEYVVGVGSNSIQVFKLVCNPQYLVQLYDTWYSNSEGCQVKLFLGFGRSVCLNKVQDRKKVIFEGHDLQIWISKTHFLKVIFEGQF